MLAFVYLEAGGKPLHADTKELVFCIHEYFESECEDAKYGRPLISVTKAWERTYEIDKIAKDFGHCVIRLPPYYCEFNPIELIWAQVKDL